MHTNHPFTLLTSPIIIWMLKLKQHHQIQHKQGQFFGQSQAVQTACINNIVHLALGLIWPSGRALAISQPLFSTLCFHFTAKRSRNMKAGPCQQPHVCNTKLRVSHIKTRCKGNTSLHKGPQPFQNHTQLPWKQKQEMAEQLCPCCLWGTDSGMLPLWLHTSGRAVSGQSWPGVTSSEAAWASQRLHTIPCPQLQDTARQEQGLGCTERQGTPTAALDHKHKNALHHKQTATVCSQCKTQGQWFGHFDHIFIL